MMRCAFPQGVRFSRMDLQLDGMRHEPFTNIDGEPFGRPALNGLWSVTADVYATGAMANLALAAFVDQMAAGAACLLPIRGMSYPNSETGRELARNSDAPMFGADHMGFEAESFNGFTMRAPASHRDSYVDVNKPGLSQLLPGHVFSLGEKLHRVTNVTYLGDHPNRLRVSVLPNIRGDHPVGTVLNVDKPQLLCLMPSGVSLGRSPIQYNALTLSFVEAF